MEIGVIGLGLVGHAISGRFLAADLKVLGHDISAPARERAEALGVHVATPESIGARAQIILLSLPTSSERRALLWGEANLAANLQHGAMILDTTTARPEDIEEDAARLRALGVRLIDVCISGSSQAVAEGQAVALVGDFEAPAAAYSHLINLFTKRAFYLGAPGQGNRAKLVVNLVFGLHRLVLAEALGLAKKGGFDLQTVLDILREGDTYSRVMDTKGPKMVSGHYEPPVARLAQHAKDVGLILEYAHSIDAQTPLSEAHARIINALVAQGHGHLDNAAIMRWFD